MHEPQQNWDDDWEGLEPESPQSGSQTIYYVGIAIALLFGLLVCGAAAYFVWAQFRERTTTNDAPAIALPTSVAIGTVSPTGDLPTDDLPTDDLPTDDLLTDDLPTDIPPAIAPTSTLFPSATSVPLGDGNVEAVMFGAPPTIDGSLAEWSGVAAVSSAYRVYSVAGWDGSEDLTAVWQLAWDNNNLYIAVTVTDDVHVQTASGNEIFRGDSVDMQFDTNRDADFGNALSPDDFQITLSPGDFSGSSPTAFRYRGTAGGAILDAPGGNSVTVAAQPVGTGYTLEAAIPWTDLSLTPTAGMIIGIALNASDNDTPGTAVQEVMISHVPNRTLANPTTWGTLTLK